MADKNNNNFLLAAGAALIAAAAYLVFKGKGGVKLTLVTPATAKQGVTVDVTLKGSGLTDVTIVKFGEGITVNSFDVESDSQIVANITIAGAAAVGPRNVSVSTEAGTSTLTEGFAVVTVGALQFSGFSVATYR